MNTTSRLITGIVALIIGLILIVLFALHSMWVAGIYGIIILVVGIFILFNKKEDEIEKIKRR